MAINKVEANGETLIDLTSDTVTADTLVSGRTAHLASGERVMGTFEPVTGVKGNAESTYRKGNVNLTPENIGAATSAQGAKADSAVQTIQIGGTAQAKTNGTVNLPAYPTKSSLGLGNVDNTSDANKPISTAAQAALNAQQAQIGKIGSIVATTLTENEPTAIVKSGNRIRSSFSATVAQGYEIEEYNIIYANDGTVTDVSELTVDKVDGTRIKTFAKNTYSGLLRDDGDGVIAVGYVKVTDSNGNTTTVYSKNLGGKYSDLIQPTFPAYNSDMSASTEWTFKNDGIYNSDGLVASYELTQKALIKEDDNTGGYVVDFDKDCKLQRNANYINLRNNSINLHADSSNISLQCGTTGSPLRGVTITDTAVRMYFGLNTLTVDEDGLWFNGTKIAE